jgi:hypothetical protein
MPEYSSAKMENFSYTAMSSWAFEFGWKKPIGAADEPIGSEVIW